MSEENVVSETKKETPSEIHAKLLCVMTEVFFMATAGLHYQVKASEYFTILGLIMRTAGYLTQKNIFRRNEFIHDSDLDFGKMLIKKFETIYDGWQDDSYHIPFYGTWKYQSILDNKEWETLISHIETKSHKQVFIDDLSKNYRYSYEEE
jgi:hypothetical protein